MRHMQTQYQRMTTAHAAALKGFRLTQADQLAIKRLSPAGTLSQEDSAKAVVGGFPLAPPSEVCVVGEESWGAEVEALAPWCVGTQRHHHPLTGGHRHPARKKKKKDPAPL